MKPICCFFVACLISSSAALVHASDPDDIVFLTNGGRVAGKIMIEDPVKGVTVRLADGTTHVVQAKQVRSVQYGAYAAPPAPVAAQPQPQPQPAAQAAPQPQLQPGYGATALPPWAVPPYVQPTHRRKGFLIVGSILMGVGLVAAVAGSAVVANNGDGDDYSGAAVLVDAGVALLVGVPFFAMGLVKVPDYPDSLALDATPAREHRQWALSPMLHPHGGGLSLTGSL